MQFLTRTATARWDLARTVAAVLIENGHSIDQANAHLVSERDYCVYIEQALLDEMAKIAAEDLAAAGQGIIGEILQDLAA
ncbi:MAG TPA: hypothetical protein VIL88_17735 [Devosia sp.]|jgi:hypothetical protein|uniref:hypothetical protein n=1 Tax=Devosia sp. TaxID=1871048 RepID=UPI002F9565A5